MKKHTVLLLGSGGRESALAWKINQSPLLEKLYIAPGNGGTSQYGENVQLSPLDFPALKQFAKEKGVTMIVVGNEDPLVAGIYDYFAAEAPAIPVIGPSGDAAQLEGSKDFAKEFMSRHAIPTARHLSVTAATVDDGIAFLGQGTIYPDIIESGTKTAKTVKSHHNVGGLPPDLQFELVEPLKMLFKDEVRACGLALGLPESMVNRQPFPGPGLGVRCLGAITRDRLEAVRASDAILREEFAANGLAGKVWQYFTLIPDVRSVGVREGVRAFEWPCVIRAVNTVDAMTATVERLPWPLMERLAHRITHEVPGVNRVLFDLTPKPVGTIEWE